MDCTAGPELQGVLHAGGVLQDATVPKQTAATVRAVYGPKVSHAQGLQAALLLGCGYVCVYRAL